MPQIKANNIKYQHKRQQGFTLLELLMVIALLGVVSIATMTVIIDTKDIESLDATEKRWDEIRKAIIGDTSLSLNNSPMLSGYVADMGRLPANLNELVEIGGQPAWNPILLSSVTPEVNGELSGGWRGPYVYTAGSKFFRDGWGNDNDTLPITDPDYLPPENYGWNVTLSGVAPDFTDIAVQSLGANKKLNPADADYDEDFPAVGTLLVNVNQWQLTNPTVPFNIVFNKSPAVDQNGLELRVYFFEDDAVVNLDKDSIQEEISATPINLLASGGLLHTESRSITGPLPMGKIAVVVWCATQNKVYDGNCADSTNIQQPYYYTLLPSTVPPITIPWNIP
ncbi:MAG: prepilin-type N-terminal cleavage/methylation domain-containing protein [Methylotenera sp.]|nr:prepilin-type N-terminal cleavage/methylation domain-containing protein [Methylotenera sp.]